MPGNKICTLKDNIADGKDASSVASGRRKEKGRTYLLKITEGRMRDRPTRGRRRIQMLHDLATDE